MNNDVLAHKDNPIVRVFENRAVADSGFTGNQRIVLPLVEELAAGCPMGDDQGHSVISGHVHDSGNGFIESVLKFHFPFPAVLFELITVRKRGIEGFIMAFQFPEKPFLESPDSFIGLWPPVTISRVSAALSEVDE